MDKFASDSVPFITKAYIGRIVVNLTDSYTSITFLKVNRTDSTTYSLTITKSNRETATSQVEIAVECKYEKGNKTIYNNIFLRCQFAFASMHT